MIKNLSSEASSLPPCTRLDERNRRGEFFFNRILGSGPARPAAVMVLHPVYRFYFTLSPLLGTRVSGNYSIFNQNYGLGKNGKYLNKNLH
jgi:hypothetical protein